VPAAGVAKPIEVRCITCHRGMTKPEQLLDILTRTAEQRGPAAALDEYRDLRQKYYGRGGYDFGAPTLNMLAEGFARRKEAAAAVEVQEFNVKVNPDIATSYGLLGDLYLAKGDRAAARGAFERAVALDPSSAFYKKRLDDLRR
jgi:tetratricopeptide (TPR) repeat protein